MSRVVNNQDVFQIDPGSLLLSYKFIGGFPALFETLTLLITYRLNNCDDLHQRYYRSHDDRCSACQCHGALFSSRSLAVAISHDYCGASASL